jgi:hypothetical protein
MLHQTNASILYDMAQKNPHAAGLLGVAGYLRRQLL